MEHRVKKPVKYKVLEKVDDVFDISTEMTPIKSKYVSKIETISLIHDDSDNHDGAEDNAQVC
jgi:hypothetical protein